LNQRNSLRSCAMFLKERIQIAVSADRERRDNNDAIIH